MNFRRGDVARIRDGTAHAYVVGTIEWREINGAWRGRIEVYGEHLPDASLEVTISRPNRPTFLLIVAGQHCHRLDVNTPHRDCPGTHVQWRDDINDVEQTRDARNEFPPIPETGSVSGIQYAATLRAFASHLGVETSALEWIDPPRGGMR